MAGALILLLLLALAPARAEIVHFHTRPERVRVTLEADEEIYLGTSDTPLQVRIPPGNAQLRFRFDGAGYATQFVDVTTAELRADSVPPIDLAPTRPDTWIVRNPIVLLLLPLVAWRLREWRRKRRFIGLLSPRPDPMVGERLDRWVLAERLGEGAMGMVFRAIDAETLDQPVALKILRGEMRERFEREVRYGLRLQHPNLVRILDWGNGYIVMELIEGRSLRQLVRPSGMPFEEAWRLMEPIVRAVAYVHHHDVVHRDLKPENVMVMASGRPVVMDFGISKSLQEVTVTPRDQIVGTLAYMAPEQVESEEIDARADQYALGVMLFELLSGRRPHDLDDSMTAAIACMRKSAIDAPSLARLRPDLPPACVAAVDRMLARSREDRFPNLEAALEQLAHGIIPS